MLTRAAAFPLWARTERKLLADNGARRWRAQFRQARDEMGNTAATCLLVVGKGDMHGALKRHARIGRGCGEDGCQKTFHVGRPASVKPVVFRSQPERIGRPFRFSGGYHIHVPGQNVTGPIGWSEGGEEIGAVSLRPRNHGYSCAMAFQIFGNPSGNVAIGRSHH